MKAKIWKSMKENEENQRKKWKWKCQKAKNVDEENRNRNGKASEEINHLREETQQKKETSKISWKVSQSSKEENLFSEEEINIENKLISHEMKMDEENISKISWKNIKKL